MPRGGQSPVSSSQLAAINATLGFSGLAPRLQPVPPRPPQERYQHCIQVERRAEDAAPRMSLVYKKRAAAG